MSNNRNLSVGCSISQDALIMIIPVRFGLFGEVIEILQEYSRYFEQEPQIQQVVLDFSKTQELDWGFPSHLERIVKFLSRESNKPRVWWQNASADIEYILDTVDFHDGGEIDVPIIVSSALLGDAAWTSEQRMPQGSVDDLLASLGL